MMYLLLILFGGIVVFLGYKLIYHTPNYETAKTTSGRTIRFLNYTEARKHKRSKIYGRLVLLAGIIFLSLGILFELVLRH